MLSFSLSLAYFTSTANGKGVSFSFAKLETEISTNNSTFSSGSNSINISNSAITTGTPLLSSVKVRLASGSTSGYMRAKIYCTGKDGDEKSKTLAIALNSLLPQSTISFTNYDWYLGSDGYFYLTTKGTSTLKAMQASTTAGYEMLSSAIVMADLDKFGKTFKSTYSTSISNITLNVIAEAVQDTNLTNGSTKIETVAQFIALNNSDASGKIFKNVEDAGYVVNYNTLGGVSVDSTITTNKSTTIKLPTVGGVSVTWYSNSALTTSVGTSGNNYNVTNHITLYAKYTSSTLTVIYDYDGGTGSPAYVTLNSSNKALTLPTPTKQGYEFKGFKTIVDNAEVKVAKQTITISGSNATIKGTKIVGGSSVTITKALGSAITLTAIWGGSSALDINNATVTYGSINLTYNGTAQELSITSIKYNGTALTKGTDYKTVCVDNKDVGTATLYIIGVGNYSGMIEKSFSIVQKTLSANNLVLVQSSLTYSGNQLTPACYVKDTINGTEVALIEGTDYQLAYSNNINVSTSAKVTMTGIGNYKGSATKTFTITNASLFGNITQDGTLTYNGTAQTPALTGTISGVGGATVSITYCKTETGSYSGTKPTYTDAGTYTLYYKATASNHNALSGSCTIVVNKKSVTMPTYTSDFTYNGKPQTLTVPSSSDYSLSGTTSATNAGSYTATLTLSSTTNLRWSDGSTEKTITWTINQRELSSSEITASASTCTYNGSNQTPSVTVKDALSTINKTLTSGTDYTVSYENNVNAGNAAKAIVTGTGNYTGIRQVLFTINTATLATPTSLSISSNGIMFWSAVDNATSYSIILYKGSSSYTTKEVYGISYDFNDYISSTTTSLSGSWTFKVQAKSTNVNYSTSNLSSASSSITVCSVSFSSTTKGTVKSGQSLPSLKNVLKGTSVALPNGEEILTGKNTDGTTVTSDTQDKARYVYLGGWSTSSSATTVTYADNATVSITSSTTFYAVWEAETEVQDMYFLKLADGTASLSNGSGATGSITIPAVVRLVNVSTESKAYSRTYYTEDIPSPYMLTSIGDEAFYENTDLTSVAISEGVTGIGVGAFQCCDGIEKISIPGSVTSIGAGAFMDCTSLTGVITIPNGVTSIGERTFSNTNLTGIEIPDSVTSIGVSAFEYCGLTSVRIPDSVTELWSFAFYDCRSLTNVTIGNSVTFIGNGAFMDCSSLTSITIPNSLNRIFSDTFGGCTNLRSVKVASLSIWLNIEFLGDYANPLVNGATLYVGNTAITELKESDLSLKTSIPQYAFNGCSSLTKVTIPSRITTIERNAFYKCSNLNSVTFGSADGWFAYNYSGSSGSECNFDNTNKGENATKLKSTYKDKHLVRASNTIPKMHFVGVDGQILQSVEVGAGTSISNPASKFTGTPPSKSGWIFVGWNTTSTATRGITSDDKFSMPGSDVIMYPIFTATNTLSFNGSVSSVSNVPGAVSGVAYYTGFGNYTYPEVSIPSTIPTRSDGYTFKGWASSSGASSAEYSAGQAIELSSDTTLYAIWAITGYTVTFDKQGGSGGSSSVVAQYGSAMPSATSPTRSGYTFKGYYSSTGGSGTQYYTSSMASARNYDKKAAITLYAYWEVTPLNMETTFGKTSVIAYGSKYYGTSYTTGTDYSTYCTNSKHGTGNPSSGKCYAVTTKYHSGEYKLVSLSHYPSVRLTDGHKMAGHYASHATEEGLFKVGYYCEKCGDRVDGNWYKADEPRSWGSDCYCTVCDKKKSEISDSVCKYWYKCGYCEGVFSYGGLFQLCVNRTDMTQQHKWSCCSETSKSAEGCCEKKTEYSHNYTTGTYTTYTYTNILNSSDKKTTSYKLSASTSYYYYGGSLGKVLQVGATFTYNGKTWRLSSDGKTASYVSG